MSQNRPLPLQLSIKNIHKRFGELEVLKGVSLEAYEGDVIALIGASGSGKSTWLRCINLLENPNEGAITVANETLDLVKRNGVMVARDAHQLRRIRSNLGFVFQNFNLWSHMTVIENLIEAPIHVLGMSRAEALEKARFQLAKVGLAHKENSYPSQISGGQQQRAAIARALTIEPKVMLFDEPTSSLDPELVAEVLGVMRDLAHEKRTMVVVTHEMSFARDVASHVVFLHQGLVEAEGPPDVLFKNPESERLRQFLAHSSIH